MIINKLPAAQPISYKQMVHPIQLGVLISFCGARNIFQSLHNRVTTSILAAGIVVSPQVEGGEAVKKPIRKKS